MANCSSAFGELTIRADKETRKNLVDMFKLQLEGANYYTALESVESEDEDSITYSFTGCGRWAYSSNCDSLYNWLKPATDGEWLSEEFKEQQKQLVPLWEKINPHDWEIEFDFTDEEQGCEVLYQETGIVRHEGGSDEAKYSPSMYEEYAYTPENLVELGVCCDIEEAKEYMGYE